ncbi:Asp-tRNA(Asn)/Glu-tRNA(Gln) amidotransferase subunit GatC [Thermotoga sp.]|uniref:Asp-tRNA(Asn)/Glu-tRNA(Gln) amidotransferase subunit GatC n=1 Tax=Thermotoga sp. TaxID=28240 RepID=UPI0025F128CF|nr:Asp-tRNA(Asn)/Glu-tRNA(Gln) amidotransferase subunit GatC [Thermotoga sp.]MCD6551754.1 Asp-tRNA(Asn)/Glu-tRNA(Gln) amidotransferase subunit GatC [Thermotoga sp.]
MIKVTKDLVLHLENLARLELSEEQRESLMKDFQEILDYVELLSEVDVEGVEPMYTPIEDNAELRTNEPRFFEGRDLIVKNFPEEKESHIKVPGIHR